MSVLQKVAAQKLMMWALLLLAIYPLAIIAARLEIWHFRNSFLLFIVAALVSFAMLTMGLLKLSKGVKGDAQALLVVIVVTLLPLSVMGSFVYKAQKYPFIHDISTDLVHAPQLKAAAKARVDSDHSVEYLASEVAQLQQNAYPQLLPLKVTQSPQAVFNAAKGLMLENGWQLMAENNQQSPFTLEASHTSLLFGFTDDLVVRIQATEDGAVVDMRSMSRVGKSDMGANAQRIQRFLTDLANGLK
ncbi:hypothetical protein A9Q73_04305 [Bermanella sp. 47_1433_sub80_T6]|nr:hypothetical protein A9Q73_04305 [Bermanella sp. 47_1433_sub80_T6]